MNFTSKFSRLFQHDESSLIYVTRNQNQKQRLLRKCSLYLYIPNKINVCMESLSSSLERLGVFTCLQLSLIEIKLFYKCTKYFFKLKMSIFLHLCPLIIILYLLFPHPYSWKLTTHTGFLSCRISSFFQR